MGRVAKTKGIAHVVLTVKNLQKSKEFYNKVCGMSIIEEGKHYYGLSDGVFSLWIGTNRDHKPKLQKFDRNQIGLDHWAFKVETMQRLKEIEGHLRKTRVEMENGGITDDDFGGTAIFTTDPDGMKVEFHLDK